MILIGGIDMQDTWIYLPKFFSLKVIDIIKALEKMTASKSQSVESSDVMYIEKEISDWIELLVKLIMHSNNTHLADIMIRESTGSLHPSIKDKVGRKLVFKCINYSWIYNF